MRYFYKLIAKSLIVGVLAGLSAVLYRYALSYVEQFRNSGMLGILYPATALFLSILMGYLLLWQPLSSGSGIPQVTGELQGRLEMEPKKLLVAKFLGGIFGGFIGLSLGREGPSIQLGAAMGKLSSKPDDDEEKRLLISAGAAAGLAAAFNAPLAGVLFAIEELHKKLTVRLITAIMLASLMADFISKQFFGYNTSFIYNAAMNFSYSDVPMLIIIGLITAFIGVLFNIGIVKSQDLYTKTHLPKQFRPVIAAILAIILFYVDPELLGGGHHMAEHMLDFELEILPMIALLAGKLIFTCLCYGSGAQGGIFLPVLVLGAFSGAILVKFIPTPEPTILVVLGMVGILASVVRAPLLAVVLVYEMTGNGSSLLPLIIVSATSYCTAYLLKNPPIYESLLERMIGSIKASKKFDT